MNICLRDANSAKQKAVIKLMTPPIINEINTEGPAATINGPMKRKKLEPMLAPKP